MNKKVLKVLEDFYKKDITVGDVVGFFEGTLKILDMNYTNQFGTFILGEYTNIELEEEKLKNWMRNVGVASSPNNPYEIVGSIHIPGYRNLLAGMGFFVKDRNANETKGYSYREAWDMIYNLGATNAIASSSQSGMFYSKLIDSVDGLPSFDSYYWKIHAYDKKGIPFAALSEKAELELKRGMKHVVRSK